MKFVKSRIEHSATVVTDDGVLIGAIYFGAYPIDDSGVLPRDIFFKWVDEVNARLEPPKRKIDITSGSNAENDDDTG